MCGIIGGNLFATKEFFKKAHSLIDHRGKDAKKIIESDCGFRLGHNRLSIQDLSETATQPMNDIDLKYTIVFNGELWKNTMNQYNDLLRSKYEFVTEKSDTELFLYGYIEYGTDVFKMFDGMYSVAIHDKQRMKIVCARDWVGRLPFYYLHKFEGLAFASERKVLSESFPEFSNEIKQIEPSHFYEYDLKQGTFESTKYFSIEDEIPDSDTDLDVVTSKIKEKLTKAVDNELISDVPVCTILSGGIDSVLITYLLKQRIPNIQSYVVNVGESNGKDDLHYARMASKWLDVPLKEVIVSKSDVENKLKDSIWASEMDSWTQITPSVAQLFLAKQIHEDGYKVVFGGEGSDELFGSYGNIQKMYYKQDTNKSARINLIKKLHRNNIIRTNTSMMYGGTVELRTPFLDKEFSKYALSVITIDAKHHKHENGFTDINWENGSQMKFPLRKAFDHLIDEGMPKELLWRKKETFQVGCHTDYLRDQKEKISETYRKLFHLPKLKRKVKKVVKSNILLKDKKDLKDWEKHIDFPVHVLGAMEKPTFNLDDIEILSTKFSKVGKTTIEKFKNLKVVITRGHGNDYVDGKLCDDRGIKVIRMNQYTDSCAKWCVDKINGSHILLYGFGNIGQKVFSLLGKVGQVLDGTDSDKKDDHIDYDLIDTVISCIPYDKKTYKHNENFFNKELFSKFKNPVDFISISRGATHNNEDLVELLNEGKIKNAHIDTLESHVRDQLLQFDNVHYYEHTAWDYKPLSSNENFDLLLKSLESAKGLL